MMAGTEFLHGTRLIIEEDSYIELRVMSTAIIGVVCTAEDADPEVFPLNRCVLVTDAKKAGLKAGKKGTLAETLKGIDEEVRAPIVVVRVAEGETDEETYANVIGKIDPTTDSYTGIKALELAKAQIGLQPRILGIPKYDESEAVFKALQAYAKKFYGFVYGSCSHCASVADALLYREKFGDAYGMLFYGDLLQFDTETAIQREHYAVPKLLGLRAKLDQDRGWHYSISNNQLSNVLGLSKEVSYAGINGYGTDANVLNEAGISCFVQDGGFRTWGNRTTAAPDSSMYFEVSARSSQVIGITLAELLKNMLQDQPMSPVLLDQFKQRGDSVLADWTRAGRILGGEIILNPELNGNDDLMKGRPDWIVDYTPAIPTESPGLTVRLTDKFVTNAI